MTDKKTRTRDPNAPLSIGRAFERIDEIERTQPQRISEAADAVMRADADKVVTIMKRVDVKDHAALAAILAAAKAERGKSIDEPMPPHPLLDDDSTPDSEPLPRGASDYRPGPAAEAARGRR